MGVPQVLVGPATGAPSTNVSPYIDFATLVTEDTANQADDTATFELLDIDLAVSALQPEGRIKVTQDGKVRFNGFITNIEPAWEGLSRRFRVSCTGISHLLDMCIIPPSDSDVYVRTTGETDRHRLIWLLDTFGGPFTTAGSSSYAYIQVLETEMERQKFSNLTLRQAIERVLGAASDSANYYVDTLGRLHTWDKTHEENFTAPYAINATLALGANEVAPSDLRVLLDTTELVNWYYVRGKNDAGSGAYADTTSVSAYGRRQAFIDGPDSDTRKKAKRLGNAALKDTKDPLVRMGFTVDLDYCENAGVIWQPGQMVSVTSPAHGLSGYQIRVIRVTTSYLNGLGDRSMEIECGALRANFAGGVDWGGGPDYPDPDLELYVPKEPEPEVYPVPPDAAGTAYLLDDFERAGFVTSVTQGTDHVVPIPIAGAGDTILLIWAETYPTDGFPVRDQVVALGFTYNNSHTVTLAGQDYVVWSYLRVLTGAESFFGSSSITVTTPDDQTVLTAAGMVPGMNGDHTGNFSFTADPPSLNPSWPTTDDTLWLTFTLGDASIGDDPIGYNRGWAIDDGRGYFVGSWKNGDGTTEDPSAYSTSSSNIVTHIAAYRYGAIEGGVRGNPAPSIAAIADTDSTGTSHTIALPDGSDVAGRLVVILMGWQGTSENLGTTLESGGLFTEVLGTGTAGTIETSVVYRRVTGSEGWPSTGATVGLVHSVAANRLYCHALLLDDAPDLPTEGTPITLSNTTGTTIGSLTPTDGYTEWLSTDAARYFSFAVADAAISADHTNYASTFSDDDAANLWAVASSKIGTSATESPSPNRTFTGTNQIQNLVAVRGVAQDSDWGQIPYGFGVDTPAPWIGGNVWDTSGTGATFSLNGGAGLITLSGDARTAVAYLSTDEPDDPSGEAWGPWSEGRAEFLFLWKVNPAGDTTDEAPNRFTIGVYDGTSRNKVHINLGDAVAWSYMDPDQQAGLALATGDSTYSSFVAKTIAADTYYYTRLDFRGDTLRARLWASSASEPTTWDATLARQTESGLPAVAWLRLDFAGNDGMVLSVDNIDATLGADAGAIVGRHIVGYGDGSTVTFSDGIPFVAGSLSVWVDNLPIVPASYDAAAGSWTFATAPYGDPADTANSAVIEASYEVA